MALTHSHPIVPVGEDDVVDTWHVDSHGREFGNNEHVKAWNDGSTEAHRAAGKGPVRVPQSFEHTHDDVFEDTHPTEGGLQYEYRGDRKREKGRDKDHPVTDQRVTTAAEDADMATRDPVPVDNSTESEKGSDRHTFPPRAVEGEAEAKKREKDEK